LNTSLTCSSCPNTCLNGGTLNPDCSCTCPSGYDSVHGGCFQVQPNFMGHCGSSCGPDAIHGSVDGSGNFLCAKGGTTACSSNSQCPLGEACMLDGGDICIAQCTSP
jgi:hypothetical protein